VAYANKIIQRRRRRAARKQAAKARTRLWIAIFAVAVLVLVVLPATVLAGGGIGMYWRATQALPQPQQTIYVDSMIGPSQLYDRSGQTLLFSVQDPLGDEREWIELETLPPYLIDATLMMEDPD